MNVSKMALWLSVFDALLVLLASTSGIFLASTYARETPSWAVQGIGQDIVNLIAAFVLLISVFLVNKGSVKAFLVWSGVLLYLIYAYVIYAFDVHFNHLFLVYVAILGISFYALMSGAIRLHLDQLQSSFSGMTTVRVVRVFFLVLGILFYLLWFGEEIPALLTGRIPASVATANVPTNPVHVLDIALYLPAMIITAWLLWRRRLIGYLLAGSLLVFSVLTAAAILAIFLVTGMKGMPTSSVVEAFFAAISVVSLVLCVLYVREVKEQGSAAFA